MAKRLLLVVALVLGLATGSALPAAPAVAQEAGTVIAEGFNGPQGIYVADDGSIWVADSGVGGEEVIETIDPASGEAMTATIGTTAQVVRISPDGEQEVMATLPSVFLGMDAAGAARITELDGEIYVTNGYFASDGTIDPSAFPDPGSIVRITEDGAEEVAALWRIERRMNPDSTILESHPYGLAAGPDGKLWVADAGANTILRVDPASAIVELVATIGPLPGVFPSPTRGGEMLADPVPTGIAFTENGDALVSLLSGAPFVPGSAKVVMVTQRGAVSDYATGLTMLTDIRRGPDGEFYAVQFAEFTDQGPTPNSGAIVRVVEGEGSEPVLEGLSFPTSIDFDDDGNAYIAINGVGPPGSGAVLMVEGLASGEAMAEAAETPAAEEEATATPAEEEEPAATATPEEEEEPEATATPVEEEAEPTATPAEEEEPAATATPQPEEEMTPEAEEATEEATPAAEEEATPEAEEEPPAEATPAAEEEATGEAAAAEGPSVQVSDQESDGSSVIVDSVTAEVAGWMVIHADAEGRPGAVLGQTPVAAGSTENVVVILDEPIAGETVLWAMLHVDEGARGVYEFPGADVPVQVDGDIVMAPFTASAPGGETGLSDLVDTAASNEQLSTLVAAIQAAGLAEALRGEGPFTVFAPTNDAFAALPDGTLDELLADPAGRLSQILLYHVVSGEVLAGDMTDGLAVDTLQGGSVTFAVDGDQIMVNDANVIAADVEATNGVIHVIDAVLTPEDLEIAEEATPEPAEEATPEAAEEATPAPEEEATPAPEEEATPAAEEEMVEATPAPEEEAPATPAAEEEAAPEGAKGAPAGSKGAPGALPDTGGEQTGAVAAIAVVALVVLALAGGVIFTRRRTA